MPSGKAAAVTLHFYLENRNATAEIKGCTETRGITKGTPQAGVLSPLIWNLPFNKLLTLYKTGPTKGTGFADDIGLLVCGPDLPTLVAAMQVAINKAQRWGTENGLWSSQNGSSSIFT